MDAGFTMGKLVMLRACSTKPVVLEAAAIAIFRLAAILYAEHKDSPLAQVVQGPSAFWVKALIQHRLVSFSVGSREHSGETG